MLSKIGRYVPLLCWVIAVFALVLIPANIIGRGYLPPDDALRHAAKAVSGKAWQDILVMRADFPMDAHPGWHALLGLIYRWRDCSAETLVIITVCGLMLLLCAAVLLWLRRPEAWLAALLAIAVTEPLFIKRLFLGRPFLFTMAVSLTLLLVWSRARRSRPRLAELIATTALIAAAAWIHGTFYQLILPAAALVLAGRWRQSLWFGGCWAAGSFLGAALTGHPWQFLEQSVRWLLAVFGSHAFTQQLVTEFYPSEGDCLVVLAVLAMIGWRARSRDWKARELVEPIFMMAVAGWILGLSNGRFWLDWGLPATLLWLALEFQRQFEVHLEFGSAERLMITAGLALALYLAATADQGARWTRNLSRQFLSAADPPVAPWLPGEGGILYSADMDVFYETFYKNPKAPWRYVLGFEPALMLPEDLEVMHRALWNSTDARAYEPWVKKLRPNDRLVIRASWLKSAGAPSIPELEWARAPGDLWIGRLPTQTNSPASTRPTNSAPQ
jgi:hypothetical protein